MARSEAAALENGSDAARPATDPSAPTAKTNSPDKTARPTGAGYSIARAEGKCQVCGCVVGTGEKLMAALRDTPAAMERIDVCPQCWGGFDKAGLLGFWQTTMHPPTAKKKVFVDDEVLCDLFVRLAEAQEQAKINFRFVLGLILMRTRRVIYESTRRQEQTEIWSVRLKGREELMDLVNPRLDERQVEEVSQQLGEILNGDL
jgi:hypothetical protein